MAENKASGWGARKGILTSAIKEFTEMKSNYGLSSANEWHLTELSKKLLKVEKEGEK